MNGPNQMYAKDVAYADIDDEVFQAVKKSMKSEIYDTVINENTDWDAEYFQSAPFTMVWLAGKDFDVIAFAKCKPGKRGVGDYFLRSRGVQIALGRAITKAYKQINSLLPKQTIDRLDQVSAGWALMEEGAKSVAQSA